MPTPILATKLYIPPPRPNFVARPRLIERLNTGLHRKLTLVSAPAGFGKTTLVSEWVSDFGLLILPGQALDFGLNSSKGKSIQNQVAWLSLDEGDNDPTHFLTYIVAALQMITPNLGSGVLAALQSAQPLAEPSGREAILTALLNEITTVPHKFILILDDYHLIDAKVVDQSLTFLLDHLPPQMHLVITTREDPQLPLARLRARGQLSEVRAADLRFTPAEAADFLNQVMGLTLSAEEITALESRTEGWVAGLQMAALSLQGRAERGQKRIDSFIQAFTGSHHFILDYLVEEVLQQQPEPVRNFLLQTAILDRFSASLCAAVTETKDNSGMLENLDRANLFVIPLDDQRQWYRYHHLFADVLQVRLLKEQPNLLPTLHQRASAWYDQHDLPAAAIRHALAAKDFAHAAGLIELAWPAMDGQFQAATWLGWARALPAALVRTRPVLSVAYAWALLNGGELEAAEARLREAEQWLDGGDAKGERPPLPGAIIVDETQFRTLPASIATARCYQAQARGDLPGSVQYGRRALDLLPAGDHLRRGPAAALLGLAHWANGELEAAHGAIAEAMANFQQVGSLHFAISGTYGLADIRTAQGRLHAAIKTYTDTLQLALAQGEPLLRGTADLYLGLSELYREQGELDTATQHLLRSEELGESVALPDWRYRFYRAQARFQETQGDLTGALARLDDAERHYRPTPVPDLRPLAAMKTRVWVAQGRLRDALRWVQRAGLTVDDKLSYLHEFEHITLARVLIAQAQHDGDNGSLYTAIGLLVRLLRAAEAGGRMGVVIEILALQALAYAAQSDHPAVAKALDRALTLAEPEGYVRLFVDEGPPMAELLRRMKDESKSSRIKRYTQQLLAAFGDQDATRHSPPATPQPLLEPLSQREIEVLALIAQGLSNQEIAARLFLALDTVKGHNRRIFDKLQVQRRTEAVARARALGLLAYTSAA